jgi:purine-binding chemotaxis protein CheW
LGWAEIRQRVDQLRAVIEQEWSPTDEEKRRILRARARTLAARRETPPPEGERLEVVEFLLASERYAIEASYLREVCPLRDFTPLPGTPPFVLGLVNVRGELLSVVDLKKFFELPERGLTDLNKVIVVRAGSMELGILADRVVGMKSLSLGEMQAPLPTLTGLRAEYLRGIGKDRLILIDAEKILFDRTIVVQEQAE